MAEAFERVLEDKPDRRLVIDVQDIGHVYKDYGGAPRATEGTLKAFIGRPILGFEGPRDAQ